MRRRSWLSVCVAITFFVLTTKDQPLLAQGSSQAAITNAIPIGGTQLAISGENFGAGVPTVTLNATPALVITNSPNLVVIELPGSVLAATGTYQLTVVRTGSGSAANRTATFDVAIGNGGPVGPTGDQGPAGATGATGAPGADGADGAAGSTGAAGATGATGADGGIGPTGPIGPSGPAGADGANGTQGPTGPQGATGAAGAIGPTGPAGVTGADGTDGTNGTNGANGATGATGPMGVMGPPGPGGAAGATGATGATGAVGITNRGPWDFNTAYAINDVVSNLGSSWIAVAAIPASTPGSEPSISNPSWQLLAAAAAAPPASGVQSVTASAPLSSSGGDNPNITLLSPIPIADGGTGSATKNFVDLTTDQSAGGIKTFTGQVRAPIFYDSNNTGYYVDPASTSNTNNFRFNVVDCVNGTCPPNNVFRLTPNLHLNSGSGYAVILNWDNGTTGANQTFRIGNGQGSDVFYVYADGQAYTTNWWRSIGNTGWYNQTYGGGWHMTDSTWIRSYNNKAVYMSAGYDSGSPSGVACGGGLGGGFTFQVCGSLSADIMYDRNDSNRRVDPNGTSSLLYTNGTVFRGRDLGQGDIFFGTQGESGVGLLPGWTSSRYPTFGTTSGFMYMTVADTYIGYWNTGGYNQVSDERMKKDIRDLGNDDFRQALVDLDKIRSVRYRYKQEPDDSRMHLGVIAQTLPDSVKSLNKQLGVYDMSQSDMLGFLVAGVRGVRYEAQDRIDALEKQIAEKDAALKDLEARLTALEAMIKQR